MDNIEKIKAEIKDRIALAEKCAEAACEKNLHSTLEANEMLIRQYKSLLALIDSQPEEKPSEDLLDAAKDALLLERAWLTLDGFGHEELAGRLRQFAERKGLIWK